MVFGVSAGLAWSMYEKVTGFTGEVRTYINMAIEKVKDGIGKQFDQMIDEVYKETSESEKIDKKQIEILTDKAHVGCAYARTVAVICMIGTFLVSQRTPYFSTLFQTGAFASLILASEFKEIQNVIWEIKKIVKFDILGDEVQWPEEVGKRGRLESIIKYCSAMLQSRLLFLNRSFLFGEEIRLLPDFVTRKIAAAVKNEEVLPHTQVKWVPDRRLGQTSMHDYVDRIKTDMIELIQDLEAHGHVGAMRMQNLVQEALRPIAFTRSTLIIFAVICYNASSVFPFSTLFLLISFVSAFFAYEMHQVNESVRTQVSERLFARWQEDVDTVDITKWIKNACLRIQDTTWVFHRDVFFGREIKKIPDYCDQLIQERGAFDTTAVRWICQSSLTGVMDTVRNWRVYRAPWARH